MRYEDFKATWARTLASSKLGRHGFSEETLNTTSLDRTYLVRVEPPRGQDARPFHVVAELSWRWTALQSARSATSEGDAVRELLGTREAPETAKPWLRVDIKLSATLMYGQPIAMPTPKAWAAWAREVLGRLENIEPLLPEERVREHQGGLPEVLAWREEPTLEVQCSPAGELRLAGVFLCAGVALDLPRQGDIEPSDEEPDEALGELFARLEGALHAWTESLDHLRPAPSPAG